MILPNEKQNMIDSITKSPETCGLIEAKEYASYQSQSWFAERNS